MLWVSDSENVSLGVHVAASEWLRDRSAFSASFSTTLAVTLQPPLAVAIAHSGRALDTGSVIDPK